ncbi:MAG: hypothetical protein ACM3L6_00300 [Deltaproteobacteria bacterium]
MNKRGASHRRLVVLAAALFILACGNFYRIYAQDISAKPILTPTQRIAQLPVFEALREYQMRNVFSTVSLSRQMMEQVAFAAFHEVHPERALRQEGVPVAPGIALYVVTKDMLYAYDEAGQDLKHVGDDRAGTVLQRYLARREALVGLIYVADARVMRANVPEDDLDFYARVQTDVLSQNVRLYCLSEGLTSMVKERVDREALAAAMGLEKSQRITLVQFVGYPRQRSFSR